MINVAQQPAWVPSELDWSQVEWDQERHPERPELIMGGYRRASTYGQRDGWRFQETLGDLKAMAFAKGWGIMLFDEGTRSGQSIAERQQMPLLLEYLRAGLLQGILVPDIKRLTRGRSMVDGDEIARVLQQRRGQLVTGRRIWDLRDRFDYQSYRREVFQAGEELISIRNTFYEGMEDRAQAVARGDAPPFWRGRPPVGYRFAVCYWARATGQRWTTDEAQGTSIMTTRGVTIRTLLKDPAAIVAMTALYRALTQQPSLGEVARVLNADDVPSPWMSKGGEHAYGWSAKLLRQILREPLYAGRWQWIRDPGETDLWYTFNSALGREVPELAYWTPEEHATFRMRFLEGYSPRKQSRYAHPWVGLGACPGCREAFIAQGRDHSTKAGSGKLRCPNYLAPARCDRRGYLAEDGIARALDAYLPTVIDQLAKRLEETQARVTEQPVDARLVELQALEHEEDGLLAVAKAQGEGGTPRVRRDLRRNADRQLALRQDLQVRPAQDLNALAAQARLRAEILAQEPLAVYAEMTETEKATLWRLLLTDDRGQVHPVPIERVTKGNGLAPAKYRVVIEPLLADQDLFWMMVESLTSRVDAGPAHVCAEDQQRFANHSSWRVHLLEDHRVPFVNETCPGSARPFACSGLERFEAPVAATA